MSSNAAISLKVHFKRSKVVFIVASDFVGKSLVEIGVADDYRVITKKTLFAFLMGMIRLDICRQDALLLPVKTHPVLWLMFRFLNPRLLILSRGLKQMAEDYSNTFSESRYRINSNIVKNYFPVAENDNSSFRENLDRVENIVYHVGSGSQPVKRIPPSVIEGIHQKLIGGEFSHYKYYILVGPDDLTSNLESIQNSLPGTHIFYSKTISDLVSLLKHSVVITGDTGVAHIASHVNSRVLLLGGPTNTVESAPPNQVKVLRDDSLCDSSPCYGTKKFISCPYNVKCLSGLDRDIATNLVRSIIKDHDTF